MTFSPRVARHYISELSSFSDNLVDDEQIKIKSREGSLIFKSPAAHHFPGDAVRSALCSLPAVWRLFLISFHPRGGESDTTEVSHSESPSGKWRRWNSNLLSFSPKSKQTSLV